MQAQDAGPTLTPEPAAEPTEPPVLIPDTTAENLTPLSQTDDAQSTTGPTPPPEVLTALSETDPYSPTSGAKTISGVPVYYWWNGCGPTAAGMVIGYWDTFYDNRGKDWLIPGNSATQTTAAEEAMASTGTKSHYSDYALPMDETTTYMLLDNSSLLEVGDRHADNSIADFMKTSWSSRYNRYGWSWFSDVVPAMLGYAKLHNPGGYTVTSAATTKMTWAVYQAEINAGHPVVLLVDSNGDGWTDHFITAVGYDTTPSGVLMYAAYDTWNIYSGNDLRWFTFHSIKNGDPWGIYGGVTFKITTALSAVPTLVSPPTNLFTTDANKPNLVWNAAANATAYQLQLSTSATFAGAAIIDVSTNTSYTIPGSLTEGKYYWRVRSQNVSDTYSAWSLSRYFTVDNTAPAAPLLALPLDNTSSIGAPLFSWKASLGAAKYQFAYAATNVFPIGAVADPVSLGVEYASSEDLVAQTFKPLAMTSGDHYWSVRAKDAAGNWSFWSSARKVSITAPIPAAPALNQPQTKSLTGSKIVNLSWYGVPYGVKYRVQVDSSIAFIAPLDFETITPDLKIDTSELLDGVHYWRVQATNVDELVYGKWSLVRYFTVDTTAPAAPSLVLPLDNATPIGAPIFSWKASLGAARYQFAYDDASSSFPTDTVIAPRDIVGLEYYTGELITLTHKPLTMTLGDHYWSVRAKDAAGNWGFWSAARKVTILPPTPAAPLLNLPGNASKTDSTSLELSWFAPTYANAYEVQIDDSIKFTSPNYTYTAGVGELSHTFDFGSLAVGTWYWHVRAKNTNNAYSLWSLTRSFTILPSFDTQFNSDNDFEGWVQNPGAAWNVTSGNLTTNGLHDWNTSSASYPATFTDFTYEANIKMNYLFDETWIWNYYGLVVRGTPTFDSWNDWKTTYYFALSQHYDNSHTSVACYQVMKIYNGKWSQLVYNCSNIIKSNDFNDLKVYANGSTLKFYINNTLMWSQTVSGISSGRLGVFSTFGTKQDGITPSLATVYVDWAKAGEPVLSSSALFEEVTPNQWPGELPSPWMNNKGLK